MDDLVKRESLRDAVMATAQELLDTELQPPEEGSEVVKAHNRGIEAGLHFAGRRILADVMRFDVPGGAGDDFRSNPGSAG